MIVSDFGWNLRRDGSEIQFFSKELQVFIDLDVSDSNIHEDTSGNDIDLGGPEVSVVDLVGKKHYSVHYGERKKRYTGSVEPIIFLDSDTFSWGGDVTALWMSEQEKKEMLAFMRKAISHRKEPLPSQSTELWKKAVRVIRNLKIITPGQKRYNVIFTGLLSDDTDRD